MFPKFSPGIPLPFLFALKKATTNVSSSSRVLSYGFMEQEIAKVSQLEGLPAMALVSNELSSPDLQLWKKLLFRARDITAAQGCISCATEVVRKRNSARSSLPDRSNLKIKKGIEFLCPFCFKQEDCRLKT